MFRMLKSLPVLLTVAGAFLLGAPPPSDAAFTLTLHDGVNADKVVTPVLRRGDYPFVPGELRDRPAGQRCVRRSDWPREDPMANQADGVSKPSAHAEACRRDVVGE